MNNIYLRIRQNRNRHHPLHHRHKEETRVNHPVFRNPQRQTGGSFDSLAEEDAAEEERDDEGNDDAREIETDVAV